MYTLPFPLIPLVLAVAARFLVHDAELGYDRWRKLSIVLVVLGMVVSWVYPSSPFRLLTRDFQSVCYEAGNRLKIHASSTVISIGAGPYPEHGVGWEAGYKASFFGGARLIGVLDSLPDPDQITSVVADVAKASPSAVLIWGRADEKRYSALIDGIEAKYPQSPRETVVDPVMGACGTIFFVDR